mgnify:CR=1 FL=1
MKRTPFLTLSSLAAGLLLSAGLMLSQNAAAPGNGKGKAAPKFRPKRPTVYCWVVWWDE